MRKKERKRGENRECRGGAEWGVLYEVTGGADICPARQIYLSIYLKPLSLSHL